MKKIIFIFAAFSMSLLIFTPDAAAQYYEPYRVVTVAHYDDDPMRRHENRLHPADREFLRQEYRHIERMKRRASADGYISRREARNIRQAEINLEETRRRLILQNRKFRKYEDNRNRYNDNYYDNRYNDNRGRGRG